MKTTLKFKGDTLGKGLYAGEPNSEGEVYATLTEDYCRDGIFENFGQYTDEDGKILRPIKATNSLEALTYLQGALQIKESDFDKLYTKLKEEGAKYTLNSDGMFGITSWSLVVE